MMDTNSKSAAALLWALGLARQHGSAEAAAAADGLALPQLERFAGAADELQSTLGQFPDGGRARDAVALGVLAGRVLHQGMRVRRLQDPTSFVMDGDLVVRSADGQSIMRLPWFEDGLFVGRQLPDIFEMPAEVRKLCIENYSAALTGERGRFAFVSYGHAYSVDAVPVHGEDGRIGSVLAIAIPERTFAAAAAAYIRMAERLDDSATLAEQRAERYRLADHTDRVVVELQRARKARDGAERARLHARRLRVRGAVDAPGPPLLTSRQIEILGLASHGLTHVEIGEQLRVSVATVKTHFDNIFTRLGVGDKTAAVAAALRHGLID